MAFGLKRPLADIKRACDYVQVQTPNRPSSLRFRDLSTVDAFVAAVFGISASECFVGLGFIADGPAIIAAMLFTGLYVSIRMSWPRRRNAWFWLWASLIVVFDLIVFLALRPGLGWLPAVACSPAIFIQVWAFLRGTEWLHDKAHR